VTVREFHAQGVKILRATAVCSQRNSIFQQFRKKFRLASSVLGKFSENVLTAGAISIRFANRHLNERKIKSY